MSQTKQSRMAQAKRVN
ncbi:MULTISPECIES: hypothetical protein [Gammaproteobacteria]